jgi:hypothetical protein
VRAWLRGQRFQCRSVCEVWDDRRAGVERFGWKLAATPAEYRRSRLVWPGGAERLVDNASSWRDATRKKDTP